jgi:hypothetical protein
LAVIAQKYARVGTLVLDHLGWTAVFQFLIGFESDAFPEQGQDQNPLEESSEGNCYLFEAN